MSSDLPPTAWACRQRQRDRQHQRDGQHQRDAGVATVWAAMAVAVLTSVLVAGLHLGAAILARHRAESAADLAALAAARQAVRGQTAACHEAATIASAGGATVTRCLLLGWNALVEVRVPVPMALPGLDAAFGQAMAGPVPSVPSPSLGRRGEPRGAGHERRESVVSGDQSPEPSLSSRSWQAISRRCIGTASAGDECGRVEGHDRSLGRTSPKPGAQWRVDERSVAAVRRTTAQPVPAMAVSCRVKRNLPLQRCAHRRLGTDRRRGLAPRPPWGPTGAGSHPATAGTRAARRRSPDCGGAEASHDAHPEPVSPRPGRRRPARPPDRAGRRRPTPQPTAG
jgi:secretion/DNA translocation related TadE-like protein